MSTGTSIEWTDATWNPTRGCSMAKGSEPKGCLNCYAAAFAARMAWGRPYARMTPNGPRWTGVVRLIPEKLHEPLRWKKPRRIFVNSMSDLFHESLPDEAIDRVFAVMAWARRHTYQILTKRPARMLAYGRGIASLSPKDRARRLVGSMYVGHPAERLVRPGTTDDDHVGDLEWPLPNVWLGTSVEDQATADARVPLLAETPAARRFISYEPALGPIDFIDGPLSPESTMGPWSMLDGIDWLIYGGESGRGARPNDFAWARSARDQCRTAGVYFFMKQAGRKPIGEWGPNPPTYTLTDLRREPRDSVELSRYKNGVWRLASSKGGMLEELPEDLRVREFPA